MTPKRTPNAKRKVDVEVRRNPDGTPDEVILSVDGECIMHLEQMNSDCWWIGLPDDLHVDFWTGRGNRHGARINCRVENR